VSLSSLWGALRRRPALVLLLVALLGAGLRVREARHAAWYWDEGFVAQVAADLGRGQRPQAGELWEDGFFPLTASFLAPASAAPFTRLPGHNALQAVRLWAALLGGLAVWLLGRVGWRLGGPALGLAAAAALAVAPAAVALGALGLYHALGTVLALGALLARLRWQDEGRDALAWTALWLGGLAWAACYWLWWLPLALGLSLAWQRPRWAWPAAALGAGPLALVLGLQLWLGGEAARFSALGIFSSARTALSWAGLLSVPRDQPLAVLGLLGLLALGPGRRWLLLGAGLGMADLLRQRGDLNANAYALLPLLPLLLLGLTAWARSLWVRGGARRLVALALLALGLGRFEMDGLRALSLDPETGRELAAAVQFHCKPGELVIGLPPLDWALRPRLRSAEPAQILAANGWAAGHLRAGLPASVWSAPVRFEDARYLVSGWLHHQALYPNRFLALPALRAEMEGWPLEAQGRAWGLYANPRFGAKPDPQARVLYFSSAYQQAAQDAEALGLAEAAAFARRRAADGLPDPPPQRTR
jgi:hypothetical protein